jgi:hypothetical protein
MALTMRPTGRGHGVYKDDIDYSIFAGHLVDRPRL